MYARDRQAGRRRDREGAQVFRAATASFSRYRETGGNGAFLAAVGDDVKGLHHIRRHPQRLAERARGARNA